MLGRTFTSSLLAPGDLACDAIGLSHEEGRGLVRMLVNAFVWLIVGLAIVLRVG